MLPNDDPDGFLFGGFDPSDDADCDFGGCVAVAATAVAVVVIFLGLQVWDWAKGAFPCVA